MSSQPSGQRSGFLSDRSAAFWQVVGGICGLLTLLAGAIAFLGRHQRLLIVIVLVLGTLAMIVGLVGFWLWGRPDTGGRRVPYGYAAALTVVGAAFLGGAAVAAIIEPGQTTKSPVAGGASTVAATLPPSSESTPTPTSTSTPAAAPSTSDQPGPSGEPMLDDGSVRRLADGSPGHPLLLLSEGEAADLDSLSANWVGPRTGANYELYLPADGIGDLYFTANDATRAAVVKGPATVATCDSSSGYRDGLFIERTAVGQRICLRTTEGRVAVVDIVKLDTGKRQMTLRLTVWNTLRPETIGTS